jgi:hypothetical protein
MLFSFIVKGQNKLNRDSILYTKIKQSLNEYPQTLYKDTLTYIVYIHLYFNKKLGFDKIVFYNTNDTCIKRVIYNSLKKVDFKQYYGSTNPLFLTIVYLDDDAMFDNLNKSLVISKNIFDLSWDKTNYKRINGLLPIIRISETRNRKPRF